MRSINLGIVVTQQTALTVTLPAVDVTAVIRLAGSNQVFKTLPATPAAPTQYQAPLAPGSYVVVVDSTIRPGEDGPFTVATDQPVTFWSVDNSDPHTTSWVLGNAKVVTNNDPKNPWPPVAQKSPTGPVVTTTGSPILGLMADLVATNAGRGADPSPPTSAHYALLIGIDHYDVGPGQGDAHYSDLQGCVTDALEIEAVLRDNVAGLQVVRLLGPRDAGPGSALAIAADFALADTGPDAATPAFLPTYANIVAAWRWLVDHATAGDLVYIHYSGHGGRVKTLFPDIKLGGVDESLVPCDINDRDRGRYLRDVEMAWLLARMADREIVTTVVLDSCHSGSFTRGDQAEIRTRGDNQPDLEPRGSDGLNSAVAPVAELAAMATALATGLEDQTWKLDAGGGSSAITVIAACRAHEGAYEYAPTGAARRGALSYFWQAALTSWPVKATYRELFARVLGNVHTAFADQTPVLLGEPDRVVLGTAILSAKPTILVTAVASDQVTLDAGEALQIGRGTILSILPVDAVPELVELARLAVVEVTSVDTAMATARRLPSSATTPPAIEVGAGARVRSYPPIMQRRVRIAAPAPFLDQLAAAIAADPSKLLTVATAGADYQVLVNDVSLVATIAGPTGAALPAIVGTPIGVARAAATLVDQLVHLARYTNVQGFTNPEPSAAMAGCVTLELLPLSAYASGAPDPSLPATAGVLEVAHDDHFWMRLRNRAPFPVRIQLLDLRPDWSIAWVYRNADDLQAGEVRYVKIHGTLPDATYATGRDVLLLLVTRDLAVDLSLLTLPVLGAVRGDPAPAAPNESPLQRLMRIMQDPTNAQRNADIDEAPSRDWFVTTAEFSLTRPETLGDPSDGTRGAPSERLASPEVDAALGGSLVAEELRGDLGAARTAARAAGGFTPILIDALTGRAGAARRALAALAVPPDDEAAPVIRRGLAVAAEARYFHDVAGDATAQLDDLVGRWDPSGGAAPRAAAIALAGPVSAQALLLVAATAALASTRRELATRFRVPATYGPTPTLADRLATARAALAAGVGGFDPALPPPCSSTWAALADADLVRRAGDPLAALQLIAAARARCEADGDGHGAALCDLAEGDTRACVIESPATLGLWIDGTPGIDDAAAPETEALEHAQVTAGELASARAAYLAARDRFAAGGRGVAAVELRLAGLAMLTGDAGDAHAHARVAADLFDAAGDDRLGWLARVHGVLAEVAQGLAVDPTLLDRLAAWGTGDGDLGYALGLATLIARAGRRWLIRDARYAEAVRCARLAERLCRALDAPLAAVQALGDERLAHESIHDRGAAAASAERADTLLASLGDRVAPTLTIAERRVWVQQAAWAIASSARDVAAMEHLAARLVATGRALGVPTAAYMASLVTEVAEQTAALGPVYRAEDLELDPVATDAVRQAAWQAADAAIATLPEPDRWRYAGDSQFSRGNRAAAAELCERFFADPRSGMALPADAAEALVRQARREQANQAFTLFARLGDPVRARDQLATLRALDGDDWWKAGGPPWQMLLSLGDVQLAEGDSAAALASYARARDDLEPRGAMLPDDRSKTAFADASDAQRLYAHAANAALSASPSDAALAFDFLERGRARALADLLADVRAPVTGDDPIARWRAACARRDTVRTAIGNAVAAAVPDAGRVADLQRELDVRERDVTELADTARAQLPERFAALDTRAAIRPLAEIAGQLAPGVLVIELAVVDDVVLGWAMTRDGIQRTLRRELDDRPLRRAALGFQRACAVAGSPLAIGDEVAAQLLAPFADDIRAAHQVVFVIGGELARIPFHALPFDGDALIARVAVSYAPSASLLARLATRPVPGEPILVVGDPLNMARTDPDTGAVTPLRALPGARREAIAIGQLVADSRVLTDDATVAAVVAALPRFAVVHLATHALVDRASPWRSALVLADGHQLTVADLMGLTFAADLVVLSACSSGTGETTRGDEVLGLARGLLAAGARAVIVSLWNVYDLPTEQLMIELHRQLQTGAAPAEALRAAQLHVRGLDLASAGSPAAVPSVRRNAGIDGDEPALEGYAHPACWAPFILVGV